MVQDISNFLGRFSIVRPTISNLELKSVDFYGAFKLPCSFEVSFPAREPPPRQFVDICWSHQASGPIIRSSCNCSLRIHSSLGIRSRLPQNRGCQLRPTRAALQYPTSCRRTEGAPDNKVPLNAGLCWTPSTSYFAARSILQYFRLYGARHSSAKDRRE